MFKTVTLTVVGIAGLIAVVFALELGGLRWKKFFAPKHEAVRRGVFKETRSFNEAKVQELVKYRLEYMRSNDEAEKGAIASTIRIGFADYDTSKLPHELQLFVEEIKYK
jgi:hypothetical protein